jgi:hypothetical protein
LQTLTPSLSLNFPAEHRVGGSYTFPPALSPAGGPSSPHAAHFHPRTHGCVVLGEFPPGQWLPAMHVAADTAVTTFVLVFIDAMKPGSIGLQSDSAALPVSPLHR